MVLEQLPEELVPERVSVVPVARQVEPKRELTLAQEVFSWRFFLRSD